MTILPNTRKTLSSIQDCARWLGLPAGTSIDAIGRSFARATNFDASLDFEAHRSVRSQAETWEVRVIQAKPLCRLEVRSGRRGTWSRNADAVPEDVMKFLDARVARDGTLETRRSWKSWNKMSWASGGARRLKSRKGEIVAIIEIGQVQREVGALSYEIRIDPIGAPDAAKLEAVRIPLPCKVIDIETAILDLRRAFALQVEVA